MRLAIASIFGYFVQSNSTRMYIDAVKCDLKILLVILCTTTVTILNFTS